MTLKTEETIGVNHGFWGVNPGIPLLLVSPHFLF